MESIDMHTNHFFLIRSDGSRHRLSLDGETVGTFPTLNAAESKADDIARSLHAAAMPRFELDFKWTLSDTEIRAASLQW
jgi:hypothetical protein